MRLPWNEISGKERRWPRQETRGAKLWGGGSGGEDRCETRYRKANVERAIRGDFLEEVTTEMRRSPEDKGRGGIPMMSDRLGIPRRRPQEMGSSPCSHSLHPPKGPRLCDSSAGVG